MTIDQALREVRAEAAARLHAEAVAAVGSAPSCRCRPGDRHPLCDLHGETVPEGTCPCWRDQQRDPDCPHHGREADPYGMAAPERPDPWLTHYDPFAHGPLTAPFYRHWSHQR